MGMGTRHTHIDCVFGFVCRILYVYLFVVHAHTDIYKKYVFLLRLSLSLSRFYFILFIFLFNIKYSLFFARGVPVLHRSFAHLVPSFVRSFFFLHFVVVAVVLFCALDLVENQLADDGFFSIRSFVVVAAYFSPVLFLLRSTVCLLSQTTTVLPCTSYYNSCSLLTSPSFSRPSSHRVCVCLSILLGPVNIPRSVCLFYPQYALCICLYISV